jgi:3-hydroxyisobutyrate dehydrogenase-like beta-hydroxyacid dehydrogenase
MKIAVLGLGGMGSAIATRLLDDGHSVRVWNRTASRAQALTALGASAASSPADAVRDVEIAITSVSDDDAVLAVVTGPDGVARALGGDAVLVDMSTVSPDTSREEAAAVGGRFVDAPILGGPASVAARQATILLGGESALLDRLTPLFDALSTRRLRCGPAGAGTTVKVVANLLLLGQLSVLSEALATAQAAGVDDSIIAELGRSPLVAPGLQNRLDDLLHGDHQGWFAARLGRKDAHLARSMAAQHGLDLAVAAAVEALFEQTVAAGLGDRDIAAVVESVRARRLAEAPATA